MNFLSPTIIALTIFLINSIIYVTYLNTTNFFAFVLIVACAVYISTYFVLNKKAIKPLTINVRISDKLYAYNWVVAIGSIFGFLILGVLIRDSGQDNVLLIAAYYSKLRYVESIGMPIEVRVLNVFLYFAMLISSMVFFEKKYFKESAYLYLTPSLLLMFQSALLGTKSIIIMIAIFLFVAFYVVASYHTIKIQFFRSIKKLFFYAILMVSLVVAVHFIRANGHMDVLDIILKIFTSYFLIPSFAFISSANEIDYAFNIGGYSFSGLTSYIFENIIKQGEFITFEVFDGKFHTNVYTAFYYLVKDFGQVGFFLILYCIVWLMFILRYYISKGNLFLVAIFFPLASYLLFAFADPLFKELTFILSFFMLFFYLLLCSFLRSSRQGA